MNADEAWDDYVRTNSITKGAASLQGQLNTMQAQMNELSNAVQLLSQVANKVLGQQGEAEAAAAPAPQPGAPPMGADPMAAGGAPPMMDPTMAGGAPPMAGGAPPMDPAMAAMGGAPAPDAGGAPAPDAGAVPGAEAMAPPAEGAPAPGGEQVDLGDDDLMNMLAGSDLSGAGGEEGEEPLPDEDALPEELPAEEAPDEEAPAEEPAPEEAPAEGGIQPTDVHAAYEAFIEALKNLAHIAVDDSRLYLVDEIANGINAISAAFGSKICPILDEMSMSAENEGETEGGPDDLFSKSYKVYKSAPLVKGMSRKQAVETFMKSGWTAPIKKEAVPEGGTPPVEETEGSEPANTEGAADLGSQSTEPVAASASPCQEEIEKSECEEEVTKSEKSEYQSFRDLMKSRSGAIVKSKSDFDTYRAEVHQYENELKLRKALEPTLLGQRGNPQQYEKMVNLAKQIEDMFSHISDDALYHSYFNTRNDNGSSLRDGTDKGIFNQDLNFGPEIDDVVNAVNATRAAPQDKNAQMVLDGAVGALNRKVAIAFEMLDRANRKTDGKKEEMKGFNPKHPLKLQDEPIGDSFRSRISTLLKPSVYGDVDKMLRLYSDILDYGQSLIDESAPKEAPSEETPVTHDSAPAPAASDSEVPAQTTQDDSADEIDPTEEDEGLDSVEEKYLNGETDMFGDKKVDNSIKPEQFDESQIPEHIPDVKPKTTQRHLEDFGSA